MLGRRVRARLHPRDRPGRRQARGVSGRRRGQRAKGQALQKGAARTRAGEDEEDGGRGQPSQGRQDTNQHTAARPLSAPEPVRKKKMEGLQPNQCTAAPAEHRGRSPEPVRKKKMEGAKRERAQDPVTSNSQPAGWRAGGRARAGQGGFVGWGAVVGRRARPRSERRATCGAPRPRCAPRPSGAPAAVGPATQPQARAPVTATPTMPGSAPLVLVMPAAQGEHRHF